ncbi:MAG: MerR family transcriptional regulator [Pseudomonadota bacterium]
MDNKGPDAFRTISEVAGELDLPQHVLRFWETRFTQIKPMKRGGGRRYYRPDDVDLLRGIRHLLYDEGYTIKGVQRILKERGVRFVSNALEEDDTPLDSELGAPPQAEGAADPTPPASEVAPAAQPQKPVPVAKAASNDTNGAGSGAQRAPAPVRRAPEPPKETIRPRPSSSAAPPASTQSAATQTPESETPKDIILADPPAKRPEARRFIDKIRGVPETADPLPAPAGALSRDDIRRLQSTLFELLECKRILDRSRSE